jgi:hypothetical protein
MCHQDCTRPTIPRVARNQNQKRRRLSPVEESACLRPPTREKKGAPGTPTPELLHLGAPTLVSSSSHVLLSAQLRGLRVYQYKEVIIRLQSFLIPLGLYYLPTTAFRLLPTFLLH